MFRVVFVMDIFNRSVVLAKGGIREKYRPVSDSSIICNSSDPLNIVDLLRPREVYIADLNRLQGKGPNEMNAENYQGSNSKDRYDARFRNFVHGRCR